MQCNSPPRHHGNSHTMVTHSSSAAGFDVGMQDPSLRRDVAADDIG